MYVSVTARFVNSSTHFKLVETKRLFMGNIYLCNMVMNISKY